MPIQDVALIMFVWTYVINQVLKTQRTTILLNKR